MSSVVTSLPTPTISLLWNVDQCLARLQVPCWFIMRDLWLAHLLECVVLTKIQVSFTCLQKIKRWKNVQAEFDFLQTFQLQFKLTVQGVCRGDVWSSFHICYQNTTSFYFHEICILGSIVGVSSSHQAMIISACGKPQTQHSQFESKNDDAASSISVLSVQ